VNFGSPFFLNENEKMRKIKPFKSFGYINESKWSYVDKLPIDLVNFIDTLVSEIFDSYNINELNLDRTDNGSFSDELGERERSIHPYWNIDYPSGYYPNYLRIFIGGCDDDLRENIINDLEEIKPVMSHRSEFVYSYEETDMFIIITPEPHFTKRI
jgi:hypothetical protein